MATRAHPIHLRNETYAALEREAQLRQVEPDELADDLVRAQLPSESGQMQAALTALAAVSAKMPEVDAVALVREGREELDRRGRQWQSS